MAVVRDLGLRAPGAVLLVSCYELGRQPQGLALPVAFLERAGFQPATLDLAVESLDAERIAAARFIGISVPMHTALRLGMQAARRIRALNPDCFLCFYGHYAVLHAESLLSTFADAVLGGEFEGQLVQLIESVDRDPAVARHSEGQGSEAFLRRLDYPVPKRTGLPGIERYAHLLHRGRHVVAGQVEASRGCLHLCRHCPIPAVYAGRIFIVPVQTVLEDVRGQVEAGARHITIADADFLNGPTHALRVARALHAEFPDLTFDFTAKVEHVLRHRSVVAELGRLGAIFMVSAVESLSDTVLEILDKGHTRADVYEALEVLRAAGIAMRPSLLPFTPWSTRQDLIDLLDFAESADLVDCIDPVQYTIRLLVPPGSLLLQHPEMAPHLRGFDAEGLTHVWKHRDPTIDALQKDLAKLVEQATSDEEDGSATFARIRKLVDPDASSRARQATAAAALRHHERPPRITEPWFC
jgi:radical SAM superfamily enzyme YgiQ (UPF0313 family)